MSQEAELGLRDRLAQLSGVKLLRGTRLSAELERLQRQLERLREIGRASCRERVSFLV